LDSVLIKKYWFGIRDSGINPEIISGILNFRDWDFRDSGLLKLPGLGFSGFRIPELQDFAGFPVFRDPEPLPSTYSSMTSLLAHTVAQPTKWRFLPKNLNQLVIFVIELEFT
jgi:hypothetical protein